MVYFQTENPNLGKFWRVWQWKMLICIFYGHFVYFMAFLYICRLFSIFSRFGI
jgi:hypothetical protein